MPRKLSGAVYGVDPLLGFLSSLLGAVGAGWTLPLSYIFQDVSFARRRPLELPGANALPRLGTTLILNGQALRLVQNADKWFAQGYPQIEARRQDATTWVVYDGEGRTYIFTRIDTRLEGANLWHLSSIKGAGNSEVKLSYLVTSSQLNGLSDVLSVDLANVQYNRDLNNCFKNAITLNYEAITPSVGISFWNGKPLARSRRLANISTSASECKGTQSVVSSYVFSYLPDADTQVPRLRSVRMSGMSGTQEASQSILLAEYTYGSVVSNQEIKYQAQSGYDDVVITVPTPAAHGNGTGYSTELVREDLNGDSVPDGVYKASYATGGTFYAFTEYLPWRSSAPQAFTHSLAGALSTSKSRFDQSRSTLESDYTWRAHIDVNGDGRLDIVDAAEKSGVWVAYLNTPDDRDYKQIRWLRREISTGSISQYLRARGMWNGDGFIPLTSRATIREAIYDVCVLWSGSQWVEYEEESAAGECPIGGHFNRKGDEITITLWDFKDINGDQYPDFVAASGPLVASDNLTPLAPPAHPVTTPFHTTRINGMVLDGNQLVAMLNVIGLHLLGDATSSFSSAMTIRAYDNCGVTRWWSSGSTQYLLCDFVDVNGDGLYDRVVNSDVYLGVWAGAGVGVSTSVAMQLPAPLAIGTNNAYTACAASPPTSIFNLSYTRLVDLTRDGIPDYFDFRTTPPTIRIGTGTTFLPPLPMNGPLDVPRSYSSCTGTRAIQGGPYDADGDGLLEFRSLGVVGRNGDVGALSAQRLIEIRTGGNSITKVTYRSIKGDSPTRHGLPYPEIVVDSVQTSGGQGLGGDISLRKYAYGDPVFAFDTIMDGFVSHGYSRTVTLQLGVGNTQSANIVDLYSTRSIADPYGLRPSGPSLDGRYLRRRQLGQLKDVTAMAGTLGTDPRALLSVNIETDVRAVGGTHYEWGARLLQDYSGFTNGLLCNEMLFPYEYWDSLASVGDEEVYVPCTSQGILWSSSSVSWRGELGAAPHSARSVSTKTETEVVDNLGRPVRVRNWGDIQRTDDDTCTEITYAAPTGTNERVLAAPSTQSVTNCGTTILSRASYEYDGLPAGSISSGYLTSRTSERRTDEGVVLGTVREFDATYDALGNPSIVTMVRNDGAARSVATTYDGFGLRPTKITTVATGLPTTFVDLVWDPVTLGLLSVKDVNGTLRGATFDGFGRPVLSTLTPPGGALGVLSKMSYQGFVVGESGERKVVRKVFSEAVPLAAVDSTPGRTATSFLDELGRETRTVLDLGSDYTSSVVVGHRTYDDLGRVVFMADAYPSTQGFYAAYGTSTFFGPDGAVSCVVRGRHGQLYAEETNEASEVFPTCQKRSFVNNQEVIISRGADTLTASGASTAQTGVERREVRTALGKVIERSSSQGGTQLELARFAYDRLGRQTAMARYLDPDSGSLAVTTSWRFDSLGQMVELDEPDAVPTYSEYSSWGELVEVWRKLDPDAPPRSQVGVSSIRSQYDALGRIIHREHRDGGVVDPATVDDYLYDQPFAVAPQVTPTYIAGRLSKASSPTGSVSYSYDSSGNVNARVFTDTQGGLYVEKRTIRADGSPASLDFYLPDTGYANEHVAYTYDSAGRGRTATYTNGGLNQQLFSISTIDPLGRVRAAQAGAASFTATYADSGRGLLNRVAIASTLGSRAIDIDSYDPVGRERSRKEAKDGTASVPTQYTYDALGRLSTALKVGSVGADFNQSITYDTLGSILSITDSAAAGGSQYKNLYRDPDHAEHLCTIDYYAPGVKRPLGGQGLPADDIPAIPCDFAYDQMGRIIQQPTPSGARTFSYFADGNVRSISDDASSAQFRYDPFGQVQELDLSSTTSLDERHDRRYGDLFAWHDEGPSRAAVLSRTIPGPEGFVATRKGGGGSWIYSFGETRGARFFVDGTGAFVQDVDYTPFGEARFSGANPANGSYMREQWNGGDGLSAFNLAHLGARLYDPSIGQFLSRDPLIIPRTSSTSNPYAFAFNDPINMSDPTGMDPPEFNPWTPIFGPTPVCCGGGGGGGGNHGGHGPPPPPPPPRPVVPPPQPVDIAGATALARQALYDVGRRAQSAADQAAAYRAASMDDLPLGRAVVFDGSPAKMSEAKVKFAIGVAALVGIIGSTAISAIGTTGMVGGGGTAAGAGAVATHPDEAGEILGVLGEEAALLEGGAGGSWAKLNQVAGGTVGQLTSTSCGQACVEIVGGPSQSKVIAELGGGTQGVYALVGELGEGWFAGQLQSSSALTRVANKASPFIAQMFDATDGDSGFAHWIVVAGMRGRNLLIADPWNGGSTYEMTAKQFWQFFTGVLVAKR